MCARRWAARNRFGFLHLAHTECVGPPFFYEIRDTPCWEDSRCLIASIAFSRGTHHGNPREHDTHGFYIYTCAARFPARHACIHIHDTHAITRGLLKDQSRQRFRAHHEIKYEDPLDLLVRSELSFLPAVRGFFLIKKFVAHVITDNHEKSGIFFVANRSSSFYQSVCDRIIYFEKFVML